jgi:hypothetical protein
MTDVEICNVALGWLGAELIASLNDESTEARLCKVQYPLARDVVLEDRAWSFAMERRVLDTPDATAPVSGFTYAFTLPTTTIRVVRADDGTGDYRIAWAVEGRKVLANVATVYIESLVRPVSEALFSPAFCQALAARLAADLAISITENRQLQADLWSLYEKKLKAAAATDGLQGTSVRIRARSLAAWRR